MTMQSAYSRQRRASRSARSDDDRPYPPNPTARSRSPSRRVRIQDLPPISSLLPPVSNTTNDVEAALERGPPGPVRLRWEYPDASESCIICFEPFDLLTHRAVETEACGHIFAWPCLKEWFDTPAGNHDKCPKCRTTLLDSRDRNEGILLPRVQQQASVAARVGASRRPGPWFDLLGDSLLAHLLRRIDAAGDLNG